MYFRLVDVEERIYCVFLIGKFCFVFLRLMIVLRLELLVVVLVVQLDWIVREEFDILIN